jgi:hypothetical protein
MEAFTDLTPYQYSFNNPLGCHDPTGLAPEKEKRKDKVMWQMPDIKTILMTAESGGTYLKRCYIKTTFYDPNKFEADPIYPGEGGFTDIYTEKWMWVNEESGGGGSGEGRGSQSAANGHGMQGDMPLNGIRSGSGMNQTEMEQAEKINAYQYCFNNPGKGIKKENNTKIDNILEILGKSNATFNFYAKTSQKIWQNKYFDACQGAKFQNTSIKNYLKYYRPNELRTITVSWRNIANKLSLAGILINFGSLTNSIIEKDTRGITKNSVNFGVSIVSIWVPEIGIVYLALDTTGYVDRILFGYPPAKYDSLGKDSFPADNTKIVIPYRK